VLSGLGYGSADSLFASCSSLTSLDLSDFDTSNITNMKKMFSGCSSLTELDLNSFDVSNVTNFYMMFNGCSKLEYIFCEDN
jgi:surface protein